jgi:hypothetical protein
MASHPTINSNLHLDSVLTVKKYLGTYHSYSLVALMMLDLDNKGLIIDLCFDNYVELNNAAEHLLGVWNRCESNKVIFRQYKINGIEQLNIDNIYLNPTVSQDIYKNQTKIYIDIEKQNNNIIYKFYRDNDSTARLLNLKMLDD